MFKLAIVGTVAAFAYAQSHPISEEKVKKIKEKTTSWEPMDPETNPLRNKSIDELIALVGT
jgi:predicted Zn-dependent protease